MLHAERKSPAGPGEDKVGVRAPLASHGRAAGRGALGAGTPRPARVSHLAPGAGAGDAL